MVALQRELGRHVTVLFGHEQGKYPDGNTVVVRGDHDSVVIDPALSARTVQPPLEVGSVLLTHAHEDHVAGVSAVRSGSVRVHPADLPGLRSAEGLMRLYGIPESGWPAMTQMVTERFHFEGWPDAVGIADGETLELGGVTVQLVHAPGHTAGHSVYVVDGDVRVVVTGDIDLSTFGPYYGDAVSSLDDFETTLAMVRDLHADHYVTFHHKGVIDGHDAFVELVDMYSAVFTRRERSLLDLLATSRTFDELVDEGIVYRAGTRPPLFGDSVERRSIEQHLQRAIANGLVASDGERYRRA
jgi:glyoxylase-like metal-dependent hydrolase (beta-lactamase superfamily II)